MGRQFPEEIHYHPLIIHPIISFSLLITSMAAISLLSSLCAVWKKSKPPSTTTPQDNNLSAAVADDQFAVASPSSPSSETDENEEGQKSLPLPPCMATGSALPADHKKMRTKSMASISAAATAAASSKKLTLTSLGTKVMQAKRENELKHEDSLWKKRIILGEKCRGPNIQNDEEKQQELNSNV